MSTALDIVNKAMVNKSASPTTQEWTNPKNIDMAQWQANEATKTQGDQPIWQQYGFGSQAEYDSVYNQAPTAPAATTAPFSPTPVTPGTTPGTQGYTGDDPFSQYLANNPGRGDAWAYLDSLLKSYDVESLSDFAKSEVVAGRSSSEITLDMMQQQPFKDRFPAIEAMKKAGVNAWTPAQIISYENSARDMMHAAGLTKGFHDSNAQLQDMLAKGISLDEFGQRINKGWGAVSQMPQDVKNQWYALGFTDGDILTHFLDPDVAEPLLETQTAATQRAAEAARAGFGQLTTSEATGLAQMGTSQAQSEQGFQQLTRQKELFNDLPGQVTDNNAISRDEQLAATFGNNAPAQQKIEKKTKERVNTFAGGGRFTQSQNGRTGVGNAQ
jgi:hypothetical protein